MSSISNIASHASTDKSLDKVQFYGRNMKIAGGTLLGVGVVVLTGVAIAAGLGVIPVAIFAPIITVAALTALVGIALLSTDARKVSSSRSNIDSSQRQAKSTRRACRNMRGGSSVIDNKSSASTSIHTEKTEFSRVKLSNAITYSNYDVIREELDKLKEQPELLEVEIKKIFDLGFAKGDLKLVKIAHEKNKDIITNENDPMQLLIKAKKYPEIVEYLLNNMVVIVNNYRSILDDYITSKFNGKSLDLLIDAALKSEIKPYNNQDVICDAIGNNSIFNKSQKTKLEQILNKWTTERPSSLLNQGRKTTLERLAEEW